MALSATEFQDEIAKLAKRGRVLVLLDTCHSAGLIGALPASNVLKSVLADGNVTVLTSTKTADKLAKEYEKWAHDRSLDLSARRNSAERPQSGSIRRGRGRDNRNHQPLLTEFRRPGVSRCLTRLISSGGRL